jgi:diketogulonate reductase-like aldo/keto reductase
MILRIVYKNLVLDSLGKKGVIEYLGISNFLTNELG